MAENKVIFKVLADTKQFQKGMDDVSGKAKKTGSAINDAFKRIAGIAALTTAVVGSFNAFRKFETGLIGVGKTADISGKALQRFGDEIAKMSARLPVSNVRLLELAQSAGQLGVKGSKNILTFTETMAKLETATDIIGAEGAQSIVRLLNVTGDGVKAIGTFGNVITALGNNTAATENEILHMATRVSQATAAFKLGTTNTLAISAAMKSLGINAEAGGTVIGRTFRAIDASIRKGGASFELLQEMMGQSAESLQVLFDKDPTAFFTQFMEALGGVQAAGGDVTKVLAKFGLSGERINAILPTMIAGASQLGKSFAIANEELIKQNALEEEFSKKLETVDSKIQLAKNNLFLLGKNIFSIVAPAFKVLIDALSNVFKLFSALIANPIGKWMAIAAAGVWGVAIAFKALNNLTRRNLIVIAITAIVTAIGWMFENWTKVVKGFKFGWLLMKEMFQAGAIFIFGIAQKIVGSFIWMQQKVFEVLALIDSSFQKNVDALKQARVDNKATLEGMNEDFRKTQEERRALQSELFGGTEVETAQPGMGGGGSGVPNIEANQEARNLDFANMVEHEDVKDEFNLEKEIAKDEKDLARREKALIDLEQWRTAQLAMENLSYKDRLKIEALYFKQKAKLETKEAKTDLGRFLALHKSKLNIAQTTLGHLSTLLEKGAAQSKRVAKAQQAVSLAQAIMGTAQGVAMALGSAPFPINIVNAALVGAAGAVEVATISKQSFAVGTDFVPNDMTANIHRGEAIIPARENQFLQSGNLVLSSPNASGEGSGDTIINVTGNNFMTPDDMVDTIEAAIVERANTIGSRIQLGTI